MKDINLVIILDLNYTLVANSMELSRRGFEYRRKHERYRQWLLDLLFALNPEAILLVTIRPVHQEEWTLQNIAEKCNGWQPDMSFFNSLGRVSPPVWKEYALKNLIFPVFGEAPNRYLPVESNRDTQRMYEKYGIVGLKAWPPNESQRSEHDADDSPQGTLF